MPTVESNALREQVVSKLKEIFPDVIQLFGRFKMLSINKKKIYLRVTTEKSGPKYWFDIKPDLYERKMADFLMYACGSSNRIYVFPVDDFSIMISGASVGGVNQVPNFTIFLDSQKLEPAGRSDRKHDIAQYYNNFAQLLDQVIINDLNRADEMIFNESVSEPGQPESTLEEKLRIQYHYRIERNLQLAEAAKQIHGYTCQVCEFNYEKVYGKIGHKYIEAHHLTPLSELPPNQTIKLSARDDFAVLCANCHSIIHRERKSVLSLQNLREILQTMKSIGSAQQKHRPDAD